MIDTLDKWLRVRVKGEAWEWFEEQRGKLREGYADRVLHITLGLIPRRLGKGDLEPTREELSKAHQRACRLGSVPLERGRCGTHFGAAGNRRAR